jgi:predicted Zn-dependent protease
MARMQAHFEQGDCTGALKDLILLRQASPDDPTLRGDWASCLLKLGNAAKAREEFTRALCYLPLWAEGYAGRAQAAAILGDERRARADLEVAAVLLGQRHRGIANPETQAAEARSLHEVTAQVMQRLGQKPPEDAVARFFQHLERETEWSALVGAAHAVHRWTNARRLWYDEAYQTASG